MANMLDQFCELHDVDNIKKIDCALGFLWFHKNVANAEEATISEINEYFFNASLPKYNPTYLKQDFQKSRYVTRGAKNNTYKIGRAKDKEYSLKYEQLLASEPHIDESKKVNGHSMIFVDSTRLEGLKSCKSNNYDLTKLIRKCEELNITFNQKCYFAVSMLTRSIIDHIPPIFGKTNFNEVSGNHGTRSFRESMLHLDKSSRKIADSMLHTPVRRKEVLPSRTQVDFKNDLDVLLSEIIRILK